MSRRRSISTDMGTDPRIAELAEHGALPVLLYTWAIPHADDWGRLTGDPRQFRLLVCPGFDITASEVDVALTQIAEVGLWLRYVAGGRTYIAFPPTAWFKYQNYVGRDKRKKDASSIPAPSDPAYRVTLDNAKQDDTSSAPQRESPRNTENHRESPQNTVSPSPSLSPSPTFTADEQGIERENVRENTQAADAALSLATPASTTVSPQPLQSAASLQLATHPTTKRKPAKVTPLRVPGAQPAARPRDVVWDACIASMGAAPSNSVERGKWAKGIKALKESLAPPPADGSPGPEITAEVAAEIGVRARRYRMRYGSSVPLNPMALAGNWSQLAHDIPAQTVHQEGQRYGHAGQTRQFTRQAASGYTGHRRGNGKPAIGTTEYYAQALLAQKQATHAGQPDWGGDGRGRAGEDHRAAALGIG